MSVVATGCGEDIDTVVYQGGVGGVEHFRQFQELHAMIFTVTSFVDTRSKIAVHSAPHTAAGRYCISVYINSFTSTLNSSSALSRNISFEFLHTFKSNIKEIVGLCKRPDVRVNILMCIMEMRTLHTIATLGYIT